MREFVVLLVVLIWRLSHNRQHGVFPAFNGRRTHLAGPFASRRNGDDSICFGLGMYLKYKWKQKSRRRGLQLRQFIFELVKFLLLQQQFQFVEFQQQQFKLILVKLAFVEFIVFGRIVEFVEQFERRRMPEWPAHRSAVSGRRSKRRYQQDSPVQRNNNQLDGFWLHRHLRFH